MRRRLALLGILALTACSREEPAAPASGSLPPPTCCGEPSDPEDDPALEAKRLGVPQEFTNSLGLRFVLVPGGTFSVGSPAGEPGHGADETRHDVKIIWSFYVSTKTVSADTWARVLGTPVPSGAAGASPATGMSYGEAVTFTDRLTALDPKWTYRLPSEAEWERAARAGGASEAVPAGANAWGVEDLADGVGEWCRDPYLPYPDWPVADPLHLEEPGDRVVRGLSPRAAVRAHVDPAARRGDVGVRLVALLSYGKADEGSAAFVFRTVKTDAAEQVVSVEPGYQVRIIAVADRLSSRQHGVRPLPWVRLPGRKSPMTLHVPPGRYYAQCEVPGDGPPSRGIELKIDGVAGKEVHVDLPVPKPGATLNDPE